MMIVIEIVPDGREHTYSDIGMKILQIDTGLIFDDAMDVVHHDYEETDIPIE